MAQVTAKSVGQALAWLATHPHHEVGIHWAKGRPKEYGGETHIRYHGPEGTLFVPIAFRRDMGRYTRPNRRAFDTRMFAVTRAGQRLISEYWDQSVPGDSA